MRKHFTSLAILLVFVVLAVGSVDTNDLDRTPRTSPTPAAGDFAPKLEVQAWRWHREYSYAVAEGQVRNISTESLRNVTAVVSFLDDSGDFITSDNALIEYDPLLPGQTSPFKVMARWNPAMKSARLEFKHLMGGRIIHRAKE